MERDRELFYIASNTKEYLDVQEKSLEARLGQIELTQQELDDIKKGKTIEVLKDKGLSLFGNIGEAISTLINWNDEVNQEINEAKKAILIEGYINKIDNQDQAILKLKDFITNPQGSTIFNKMLRILDDSPPDEELLEHLSSVLKHVVINERFKELFDQHRYALNQIERLTPQSLTIISDYQNWPSIRLGASTAMGPKITSDWHQEFTEAYCKTHRIYAEQSVKRVMHSIIELQRQGFIEAFKGEGNLTYCKLTQVGSDIQQYL